jgi:hypothetical protein
MGISLLTALLDTKKNPKAKGGYWLKLQCGTENNLATIYMDESVTVSLYAQCYGLLNLPGCRGCRKNTKSMNQLARMINRSTGSSSNVIEQGQSTIMDTKYLESMRRQAESMRSLITYMMWQDAKKLEIEQLFQYATRD